jgi:ABC-type branched-subunit amino acid transport system substrate-binding protein
VLLLSSCAGPFDSSVDHLKTIRQVKATCRDLLHFTQVDKPRCNTPQSCVNGIKLPAQCFQVASIDELLTTPEIQLVYAKGGGSVSELQHLKDGLSFAAERINQNGGIYGRPIKLKVIDGELLPLEDMVKTISTKIAADTDNIAVFGHFESEEALASSITYERNGVLFISPYAGRFTLTQHGFRSVFSTTPNNNKMAEDLVNYARQQNWQRVAVIFQSDLYGPAFEFIVRANNHKIRTVLKKNVFPGQMDYRHALVDLTKKEVDGILLAASAKNAAQIITSIRKLKITKPVLGFRYLASKALIENNNDLSLFGEVFVPILDFDEKSATRGMPGFKKNFGYIPDLWATRGFDNFMLVADAIKKNKSSVPLAIASTLRYLDEPWHGLSGIYQFEENGTLMSQSYTIVDIKNLF